MMRLNLREHKVKNFSVLLRVSVLLTLIIAFTSKIISSTPALKRLRNLNLASTDTHSVIDPSNNTSIIDQLTYYDFQHQETMIQFDENSIPPPEDWEKALLPVLEKGLILSGDSTSRLLFGFVWCVMEGFFSDGLEAGNHRCQSRQSELKDKMSTLGSHDVVTFSKYPNATMAYFLDHKIRAFQQDKLHATLPSAQYLFFRMPCLHELWNPGWRETYATHFPAEFPRLFEEWYESINHLEGTTEHGEERVVMIAPPVALCDEKMGPAKKLIDAWLNDEPLNGQNTIDSKNMIQYYNKDLPMHKQLPLDYTGAIPPMNAMRRSLPHKFDDNLFNDKGARFCSSVGQEVFGKMKFVKPPFLLDSRSAYENRCESTRDGRHYGDAITMMREVSLILKAHGASLN